MFSIEDIDKFVFEPFKKYCYEVDPDYHDDMVLEHDPANNSTYLEMYDGEAGIDVDDVVISVFLIQTPELILFREERSRRFWTLGDTWGNIVYNGSLLNKSKEEILGILLEILKIFHGATKVEIEETDEQRGYYRYPIYNYIVKVSNALYRKNSFSMDNIHFMINEESYDE